MKQLIVSLAAEGSTDKRFLTGVIQRSFEKVAYESAGEIEVLPVITHEKKTSNNFIETVVSCALEADKQGAMVLCIHHDADAASDEAVFTEQITPAFAAAEHLTEGCKNLVAVVPVRMMEAWMLGDKNLLKREIGTNKSDQALELHRPPEAYADPKEAIKNAIRIARANLPKRRRGDLNISELYQIIGQKIPLSALEALPSYQKFKNAVRQAFRKLGYLE